MRKEIQKAILKGLLEADGTPMPQESLIGLGLSVWPMPPRKTIESVITELESEDYIDGVDNKLTGRSWTLTDLGQHAAQKL